jgi:catechol 2,3-dioxygenase-like lactoylglutathione lyase family enzyme
MISGVGSIAILAYDASKLAEWYRDTLGFEIVESRGHSVFLRPKGSNDPLIHLCGNCDDWGLDVPGGRTGIWLHCGPVRMLRDEKTGRFLPSSDPKEVEETFLELKSKGVEFSEELRTMSWGKYAILKDPEGNELELS